MTAERDGKSRRTGQPDLLASLPDERPPASQPAPGIDPAAIEELVTGVRDIREQFAGLREAEAADRPAPVPAALTPEALEAWGDKLVARVAEAARTADAPGDEAAATRIKRIEDAAARAAAAAERIDGGTGKHCGRLCCKLGEGAMRNQGASCSPYDSALARRSCSHAMASVRAHGPRPKARSTIRASPTMPPWRANIPAWPLRSARITSKPLIVA